MKVLSYIAGAALLIGAGIYFQFFYVPQNPEQEEMNATWAEFAHEIGELGELVENAPFNVDERTAGAGYHHMARYLSSMIAQMTDHSDADFPQFARFPNMVARIGWDNPDNPYLSAYVRGDHTYRLRGNVSGFDLISINVYSGLLGYTPMAEMRTISGVISDELEIADDGSFELILSSEPHEGNWLKLEPDADNIVVRRLVSDWDAPTQGRWEILNLDTLGTSAKEPDPAEVARRLRESVKMARGIREILTIAHRLLFQMKQSPNFVPVPALGDPALPMSDPFQATSRAQFRLADDEALLIELPEADCKFANIQLANPWMESLDYASRQSSLNHHTSHVDEDGIIRYVVSKIDPGAPNWLDTAGWPEGSLFGRWTHCTTYPTELEASVVKLAELWAHLPTTSPRVTPAERAEVIARRQAAISRRYAGD